MKRLWLCVLMTAACGEIPEGAPVESLEAPLRPGDTFTRTIPAAPSAIARTNWTGGAILPPNAAPLGVYYVAAGDAVNTDRVVVVGFDVRARRALFNYSVHRREYSRFMTTVHDTMVIYSLQSRDTGGAGNITPRCCIGPGDDFFEQAWGTAYLLHEANVATIH